MKPQLLLFVAAGLFLGADATDAKKDLDKMQGDWVLVSSERDGKPAPEDQVKAMKRTVKDDTYTVTLDGKPLVKGTFKVDPSKKPATIDALRSEGEDKDKPMLGIYEFDGDTYKVCFAPPGKDRPTEFASKPGSGHVFSVWKREKK
jgi:uncharacterized protein (TIGR03067 family)